MLQARTCHAAALALALLCTGSRAQGASQGAPGPSAELRGAWSPAIDALFADHDSDDAPGSAVLVMRDGEVVHAAGYGVANVISGEPITPRTVFGLGALTMPFTSTAVLMLVDREQLRLEDPVAIHVPELVRRYGLDIEIRHLLAHTSGLPDYYKSMDKIFEKVKIHSRFGNEVKRLSLPANQHGAAVFEFWGASQFPPGTDFRTSNPGYEMLALAAMNLHGQPFSRLLQLSIIEPLGMSSTFVADHAMGVVPHRAYDYQPAGDGFVRSDYRRMERMMGAQGIHSSLEDMVLWERALASGELLSPAANEWTTTPVTLEDGRSIPSAFGWSVGEYAGQRRVFHDGGEFGFRSAMARHPDLGLTVVILSNREDCDALARVDPIVDLFLEPPPPGGLDPERPATAAREQPVDSADAGSGDPR
jgi:CubicO group peptidase (beta-lactamase class C family)